jgi:hypothetical protein
MTDPSAPIEGEFTVIDVINEPWAQGVRGGLGGVAIKTLFEGSTVSLIIGHVPRLRSTPEFHDCPEELYVLDGDGTSKAGTMGPGSYFWRPEYITHGPYWIQSGLHTFVRGHGDIVAYWIENPDATPEENRAYAATLGKKG